MPENQNFIKDYWSLAKKTQEPTPKGFCGPK